MRSGDVYRTEDGYTPTEGIETQHRGMLQRATEAAFGREGIPTRLLDGMTSSEAFRQAQGHNALRAHGVGPMREPIGHMHGVPVVVVQDGSGSDGRVSHDEWTVAQDTDELWYADLELIRSWSNGHVNATDALTEAMKRTITRLER